jgi:hypothetical protein
MGTNPSAAVGQVSADGQFRWDGQQWVPIAPGTREPTPWTRPMQLAAAGLLLVEAVVSVATTLIYVNHDNMLKAIKAQGTQIPSGSSIDAVINIAIAGTIGVVVFFAVCELVAAIGSYLGWRWIFWVVLVVFAFGSLDALTGVFTLARSDTSPVPLPGLLIRELLSILALATFVWMLVGLVKFGPWAMRKPGK